MNHRQKQIKITDSSELGWKVVHEYESNPLASDSDDEKSLYKAETRAERIEKAERVKRANKSGTAALIFNRCINQGCRSEQDVDLHAV